SRIRYRAIAIQHDAVFVRPREDAQALGPGDRLLERVEAGTERPAKHLQVPRDVTQALGELDSERYRAFLWDQRRTLRRWWRTGEVDSLHEAIVQLGDVLVTPRRL